MRRTRRPSTGLAGKTPRPTRASCRHQHTTGIATRALAALVVHSSCCVDQVCIRSATHSLPVTCVCMCLSGVLRAAILPLCQATNASLPVSREITLHYREVKVSTEPIPVVACPSAAGRWQTSVDLELPSPGHRFVHKRSTAASPNNSDSRSNGSRSY